MESFLSERSLYMMYFGGERDSEDEGESTTEDIEKCAKLQLNKNISAYIEKRELIRNTKALNVGNNLLENVTSNYIIVKQIISNLCWQEKLMCKLVCSTWHAAVQALEKEQLSPEDFVIDLCCSVWGGTIKCGKGWFKQSGIFNTEPLVIFTFANTPGVSAVNKCKAILPSPCEKPCQKEHCLLDLINRQINAPKNCMLTVTTNCLVYRPLPFSVTYEHSITYYKYSQFNPFIAGIIIPKIPEVGFQVLNINSLKSLQQEFYDEVDKVSKDNIIKGVLVYVTEKYILNSIEDIVFLNYFKDVQPNVPYALGGCIIEDTISDNRDVNLLIDSINEGADFISENLISIGLFTVPKNANNSEYNFEIYSFIIDSSAWSKPKIQESVEEFSKSVPRFEHSIALKLSCVGRDQKHLVEQDCFRAAFPKTTIIGCYGNGELGLYHPTKPQPEASPHPNKRHRSEPQFGFMYLYSTVFVYIGWGKITSPKGPI